MTEKLFENRSPASTSGIIEILELVSELVVAVKQKKKNVKLKKDTNKSISKGGVKLLSSLFFDVFLPKTNKQFKLDNSYNPG